MLPKTSFSLLAAGLLLGSCAEQASEEPGAELAVVQGPSLEQPTISEPVEAPLPEPTDSAGPVADAEADAQPEAPDSATEVESPERAALRQRAEDELGITNVTGIDDLGADLAVEEGTRAIAWRDVAIESDDVEDILDKLLYPDQYEEGEFNLPDHVQALDGETVAIVGYQIPLEWEGTTVPEFMLVGDLLGCCFGGAPRPDEWINVKMKGKGAEYFPYIPVIVTGTLRIEGIEDDAGYAAGCYHIDAESCEKEL